MTDFQGRRRFLKAAGAFCMVPFFPVSASSLIPSISGLTMGTLYTIRIADRAGSVYLPELRHQIEQVLESTDSLMSTYRTGSELSRLNHCSCPGWSTISVHTARVIEKSLQIHERSGGTFNPAVGNLVNRWGFGAARSSVNDPNTTPRNTFDEVGIELSSYRVRKTHPEIALDLNGIAKGDAVDRVGLVLASAGISNYVVEIGGEVLACGTGPEGNGWRVGIAGPPGSADTVLNVDAMAVATSGDYIQYFDLGGRRYSHLLNPHSGMPVHDPLSMVCVAATTAMEADAWSTALMVMGLEKGKNFALENRMAVQFVYHGAGRNYDNFSTPLFKKLIADDSLYS